MSNFSRQWIVTSALLDKFPRVLHGFGTKYFQEKELNHFCQSKNLKPITLKQLHSDHIHLLEKKPDSLLEGDALVTYLPGFVLTIKTADCLPVLIVDPINQIVAAVHCGWRGTAARLLEKVINFLIKIFGTQPENLYCAFGPCISQNCYEVGEEVRKSFNYAGFSLNENLFKPNQDRPNHFFLDLRKANRDLLLASGIEAKKIDEIVICPHCHQDFLSRRRDGHRCGRLLNFIGLLYN
ncbi:MAG: peptidoglycan editing factor PgeF [Candidatus Aminicenantes bacterium]|nr:peptidoglycan editing factor PgeF [Candidatus Aminicenantes bacterium]